MRLNELRLRFTGDEFRMRFHDRLTVVSGIGMLERAEMVDSLLSAAAGGPLSTVLTYTDAIGQEIVLECDNGTISAHLADGEAVPGLLESMGLDTAGLRGLMTIDAAAVGLDRAPADESPELTDARTLLAELTGELDEARRAHERVERLRARLAEIDEALRLSQENRDRRLYAKALTELEKVRAEAAALTSGHAGAATDKHLVERAENVTALAAEWKQADARAQRLTAEMGQRERLDEADIAAAAAIPDEEPPHLEALADALAEAETHRDRLARELEDEAASKLPEPSDPCVSALARIDQDVLWTAHRQVLETAARVEEISVMLGGLRADVGSVASELDAAHEIVFRAERAAERLRRPGLIGTVGSTIVGGALGLVAPILAPVAVGAAAGTYGWAVVRPGRKVRKAEKHERAVLDGLGAPSWLGFHIRRVESTLDPDAREKLELAEMEHRMAGNRWAELVGDELSAERAGELADEIREHARAIESLGSAAEELENLRLELEAKADPAAAMARSDLLATCAPFGVTDTELATELVRHRVEQGRIARLQLRLEQVESEVEAAAAALSDELRDLGFVDGDLAARVGAMEWAVDRAGERARARTAARDPKTIEADLERLEKEVSRLRRPEWANLPLHETDLTDPAELAHEREELAAEYDAGRRDLPDLERIADRHHAIERRVAVLQQQVSEAAPADASVSDAVRQRLMGRLAAAAQAGPDGDPIPLILDEPLHRLDADQKWQLLDALERLTEKVQVVYLTDDVDVATWSRRKAATDALTLMEPAAV